MIERIDLVVDSLVALVVAEFADAMRHLSNIVVLVALAVLLVSPVAWGCDGTGMQECDMPDMPPDCPMSQEHGSSHCGQDDEEPAGCDGQTAISVDCCEVTADRAPAEDSPRSFSVSRQDLEANVMAGVQSKAPPPLPADATFVIRTQQHELGRFTMLSSFLL